MSRENVEVVRRVYDAVARRDAETVFSLYDADVELDNSRLDIVGFEEVGRGVSRGHDGLRRFFREWYGVWEDVGHAVNDLIDAGDEHVISVVTTRGRGRASGAGVELTAALAWTVHHEKVVRVVWFPSREEALKAVGMEE